MVAFSSPSGNIDCWLDDDSGWAPVRCDTGSHTWTAPPSGRPRDCTGDYGSTLGIGPHGGLFGCASDAIGPSAVLAYGKGIEVGKVRCLSSTEGMRCVDRSTGHGFLVSRDRVHLF